MVVSKDSKRKRKESPPPQPPMIESSPEMPKRTKVQAQRKFAQGQSAPTSSYTAALAASSSSTTGGPSASSESREPPTEILPNKRPKTEDFLTFLCFRGTSALPAHLDFLNQGKPAEPDRKTTEKKKSKVAAKTKKKPIGKKGGKKAKAAQDSAMISEAEPVASTSAAAAALLAENNNTAANNNNSLPPAEAKTNNNKLKNQNEKLVENQKEKAEAVDDPNPGLVPVSKTTTVIGSEPLVEAANRRSRVANEKTRTEAASSKSPDNKRRSNRSNVKDMKPLVEADSEEENEEQHSANGESEQQTESKNIKNLQNNTKLKTPTEIENQIASSPMQEQESNSTTAPLPKGKKGKAATVKNIPADQNIKHDGVESEQAKESQNTTQKIEEQTIAPAKAKQPVKRTRQKESPIFIPSPEPTGRMTRQRAFFEPVKVLPRENADDTDVGESDKNLKSPTKDVIETPAVESTTEAVTVEKPKKLDKDTEKATAKAIEESKKSFPDNKPVEKNNSLNVFDFSSEDEQPLSKTIKLKKEPIPVSPKKTAQNMKRKGKKLALKKSVPQEAAVVERIKKEDVSLNEKRAEDQITKERDTSNERIDEKSKRGGAKATKKKQVAEKETEPSVEAKLEQPSDVTDEMSAPVAKKIPPTVRQPRKLSKAKCDSATLNGTAQNEESEAISQTAPVRSQRPSRKTKEAAAIYMGIIGHKLQQNEDEDDELSLNSFPDLPNVKETEKMEFELKKNAATSATSPSSTKSPSKSIVPIETEKPAAVPRRGRPPKQGKPPPPAKREIEGMLIKKGALAKVISINAQPETCINEKQQLESTKATEEEEEDFLLNEEVNETKRKLEKSFSDSDDEPLAVKVNLKTSDKDIENESRKSDSGPINKVPTASLTMLPLSGGLTQAAVSTPPVVNATGGVVSTNTSPITTTNAQPPQNASQAQPSFFKVADKKSPIPNAKILNVPAAYPLPGTTQNTQNSYMTKMEHKLISPNLTQSSYLPPASPHYHAAHSSTVRSSPHPALQTAKSPTQPPPVQTTHLTHISAPPPPSQSPLKYQTPPTTYPPPIEAYPSPKINPNFLTPKFDRSALPRTNNFPSPSPVKFDLSSSTAKTGGLGNSTLSPKTLPTIGVGYNSIPGLASTPTTSSAALAGAAAGANTSSDPLKDEIGSILAANLMPSKEESGKIFGIASVSLAQSSGPDNTKCTLGKCGSIHKPVLGPVVPTEGYIGDQLSSKERRKAKVNMTHEQIQKWLIECSSNPDEIQDDLDDDYDDNLRPNLFATTPPPTRDDKESTSFSSSSKATRDLGKSESAWSGKGPSLKAIPVVATTNTKEEDKRGDNVLMPQLQATTDNEAPQIGSQTIKANPATTKQNSSNLADTKSSKDKVSEKRVEKKSKDEKPTKDAIKEKEPKQSKVDKEKEHGVASGNMKVATAAGKQSSSTQQANNTLESPTPTTTPAASKPNRKKNATTVTAASAATSTTPSSREEKHTAQKAQIAHASVTSSPSSKIQQKRTPVYNQKAAQKQVELKETTTTSHKKKSPFSYTFGAFSVDNEKSIYSFDKDDDDVGASKPLTKPIFRRQSRRDSHLDETTSTPTPATRVSPAKKRNAGGAVTGADKTQAKDTANASQISSVSLTLSPAENCKQVKVSLEAEQEHTATATATKTKGGKLKNKLNASTKQSAEAPAADSDSDGHTFYIPLQGTGTGAMAEGGIQGVAVKLGREGPEGPNQKVIMHATLVTKAQMGQNSKPLPDSMNASEIVKNLLISSSGSSKVEATKKSPNPSSAAAVVPSTSSAAAAINSAPNSLKSVPIGTVQPRFKGTADPAATTSVQPSTSTGASGGSGLVRVNSNSSLFSGSAKSRHGATGPAAVSSSSKKFKDDTPIKMSNNTAFPRHDDPTQMVEAPIFRPTEKEFSDPMDFIERITPIAARFGICKIIPPVTFKPECRISDEMRFTAYNQYVHKMLHRWGPSAKELSAIKKYLATQSIVMNHPPWIGGMEVDLPRLYHTVQELGGLKEVIEKKKWARVAEEMCIPKLAQDRVTKLDDIYCKYLLPYDTLSPSERQKLFDEVEADWAKREARARRNADRFVNTESVSNEEDDVSSDDDEESEEEVDGVSMECIVKGRSMPLSQFYRIARNTMTLWFKNTEPTVNEVEAEFWRHVAVRDSHVCVHSGSIDSSGWGYGFPSPGPKGKGSNYARHPWNLKVLTNNPGSVLRSLGPVMGVTVPTLHVGMLFSACCWYRDPHGLSWIEYLHTGASKLWYGIPDDQSANFRAALTSLIPTHCQNKTIWLPCDTVMVPPHMLTDRGVSLCRIEQKPGEFIVVFPRAYTSSLATGYVVSESVYFATNSWLDLAKEDFRDIHDSCEPAMFSLEQLLFALGSDQRVSPDTLQQMLPMLNEVYEKETAAREQLKAAGVTSTEKVPSEKGSKSKKQQHVKSIESECDLCRANLYISMVRTDEGNVYCLQHALKNLNNGNIQAKQCKLIFAYHIEDIENLIKTLNDKIQQKRTSNSNKKSK